jgi:hypothetical protein
MHFTDSTPRESAVFQGFKLAVPVFFSAATAEEFAEQVALHNIPWPVISSVLQQVVGIEGPRNNVAKSIKEDVILPALTQLVQSDPARFAEPQGDTPALCTIGEDGTITVSWDGKVESLPDEAKAFLAETCIEQAQSVADAYFKQYVPLQPRKKGVSGPSLDPVEDLARAIFSKSIYASWAEKSFKDLTGKVWTGVKSQERAGSSHQAANAMLAAGKLPSFLDKAVIDRYDGEITTVKDYVEAYTELLFSSTTPAGQAKVERLREMAREQLAQAAEQAKAATSEADELLGA